MKLILVFLIFGSVIAAGSALSCITCNATGNGVNNCQCAAQQCEDGTVYCSTELEYNILRGDNIQTVRKRCMPKDQNLMCNQQMFLNTTKEFEYVLYAACCNNSDGCNTGAIQMPPLNLTKNGHSCPSCFVEDSLKCTEFGTVECACKQYQCFNFSGIAARPGHVDKQYAFQGCITYGTCLVDLRNLPGSKVAADATYTCT